MAKQSTPSAKKPNILVIWGDDIGITNLSCYSHGLMGYRTPNIDRLAKEGMLFTDSYGEQSCTAGRASFITGQSGYRTGRSLERIRRMPVSLSGIRAATASRPPSGPASGSLLAGAPAPARSGRVATAHTSPRPEASRSSGDSPTCGGSGRARRSCRRSAVRRPRRREPGGAPCADPARSLP